MIQPHSVPDEEYHIVNPDVFVIGSECRPVDRNPFGQGKPLVLETTEVTSGPVKLFCAGHTGCRRRLVSDAEILVGKVIEKRGAGFRVVGVDIVYPHVQKDIIWRDPFRSAPEPYLLAHFMYSVNDFKQAAFFRIDNRAFSVP